MNTNSTIRSIADNHVLEEACQFSMFSFLTKRTWIFLISMSILLFLTRKWLVTNPFPSIFSSKTDIVKYWKRVYRLALNGRENCCCVNVGLSFGINFLLGYWINFSLRQHTILVCPFICFHIFRLLCRGHRFETPRRTKFLLCWTIGHLEKIFMKTHFFLHIPIFSRIGIEKISSR